MTDIDSPDPAVAVPPSDSSSDREQSDADNAVAVQSQADATSERAANREQADTDAILSNEKLDKLIETSEGVIEANSDLAMAMVAHQERARLAKRRYLVTVLIILLGFGGLYWRQENENNTLKAQNDNIIDGRSVSRNVLAQIQDCLNPEGKCYKDGQKNQLKLLQSLGLNEAKIASAAAACAPHYVDLTIPKAQTAILSCILRELTN